jgi:REP element-mobilizing transposase RayT
MAFVTAREYVLSPLTRRYLPEGGALVEVTCRTLQGRLLLRPDPELNDIAAGILGRSQRLYPVDIVAYVAMSTHYHLLVWAEDAQRLSRFVGYFNSNLAREVSPSRDVALEKEPRRSRRGRRVAPRRDGAAGRLASGPAERSAWHFIRIGQLLWLAGLAGSPPHD